MPLADPDATGRAYDESADGFDERIAADPSTLARFRVIDEPQRALTRGCERALEIGCGSGRLLATLEARRSVCIDVSQRLLVQAARRGLTVVRGDAHALPFRDGSFAAVVGGNAVFRYLDYARAFCECARVLSPGGRLAVDQYAARCWSPRHLLRPPLAPDPRDVDSLDEIRAPASAAGLRRERIYLWRALRVYPYVVRLPERLAGRLWDRVTLIVRKTSPGAGAPTSSAAARLAAGASVTIRVTGRSMEPTLQNGAAVVLRPRTPRLGDVVLLRGSDEPLLHRLVGRLCALGWRRWVHAGDAEGALPGLGRDEDLLGVADTPPRPPTRRRRLRFEALALACAARRALGLDPASEPRPYS